MSREQRGRWVFFSSLKEEMMNERQIKRMDKRVKAIRKAAEELKELSKHMPAVERNAARILASVKMLEINVSDLLA